jgi:hypothetical protein
MFIESPNGYWNLHMLTSYQRIPRTGGYLLMFPIGGGNVKISPSHPQFRQIEQHLIASTLGPDQPDATQTDEGVAR